MSGEPGRSSTTRAVQAPIVIRWERCKMCSNRHPVGTRCRSGQRVGCTACPNVVERVGHHRPVGLNGNADFFGEALYLRAQRSEVVCRNGRSSVIRGALRWSHFHSLATERLDNDAKQRIAIDRKRAVVEQPARTSLGVGQRHQRVQGADALVRRKDAEAGRAGRVDVEGRRFWECSGDSSNCSIGDGDEHDVRERDLFRQLGQLLLARSVRSNRSGRNRRDDPPSLRQSAAECPAGSASADNDAPPRRLVHGLRNLERPRCGTAATREKSESRSSSVIGGGEPRSLSCAS